MHDSASMLVADNYVWLQVVRSRIAGYVAVLEWNLVELIEMATVATTARVDKVTRADKI